MDKITLDRIKLLHPILRDEAGKIYQEICDALTGRAVLRFTHTFRSFAEQDMLFEQGRSRPGKRVTNARGGHSWHNWGMAIDIVLMIDKNGDGVYESAVWDTKTDFDGDGKSDWIEVVQIFKEFGWEWGGDWKFVDAPHFQKTMGHTIRGMLSTYRSGKLDKNGFVIL